MDGQNNGQVTPNSVGGGLPSPTPVVNSTIIGGSFEPNVTQQALQTPVVNGNNTPTSNYEVVREGLTNTQFLVMYVLSFFLIASILASASSLVSIFFDNFNGKNSDDLGGYLSGFKLYLMLWSVSNLLVVTPVFIFLILKMRKFEPNNLTLAGSKLKNLAYGIFMILLGLATLTAVVSTVYQFALKFAPKDSVLANENAVWWTGFASALVTALLLTGTFIYYLKVNSSKEI